MNFVQDLEDSGRKLEIIILVISELEMCLM